MKKLFAVILIAASLCLTLSGCGNSSAGTGGTVNISFSDAVSIDRITELNGKKVSIIGYMATLSPISGKYMYLMNMPYQSCPFCVPNTTQLSNTMAVYAPSGKTFTFTDQAVRITGRMELGDYTDEYGYVYNYRIVDAVSETVDLSTVSEEYSLWQAIAADGVVAEINDMFNYLHFICCWPTYGVSYTDDDGQEVSYNLYPGDVDEYLKDSGPNGYAKYYADSYFPSLTKRIQAIDGEKLSDLVAIVNDAKAVELSAREALLRQAYKYDAEQDVYKLNDQDGLYSRWQDVYVRFSEWLAKWQL